MSTCVPTPVSTVFSTVTVNTITTTYSLSTSTAPPVVTTHADPYCQNEAVVLDSAVCLKTGTRTRTETLQPASDVIYTIPYETTIPVATLVPISTAYNGCSDAPTNPGGNGGGSDPGPDNGSNNPGSGSNSSNGTNPDPNGNNGGAISVPPGHTLVTSSVLVYTTGPPETSVIPSVMTLPNGQVTTRSILTVVTPKPSQVYVPTTALVEATGSGSPGSQKCRNVGVIVGAVVGGFIGLCLMILAWWYVRRRRKTTYDEILHVHEKQVDYREAHQQAIERSKDPNRKRESDPKPTPYHYGSLLSSGGRIQSSTSTGVMLSQNPFEGSGVGNRATYMVPGSPLFTTVPKMGEFEIGSGLGIGAGVLGVGELDGVKEPMNPPASSTFCTSGTDPAMNSATTLESSSRSSDMNYLGPDGSTDEFIEVDIGGAGTGVVAGSGVISSPPHLSMSFGSWNTNTSQGRESGGSKQSSGMDPDSGPGTSDGGHRNEDEGQRRLLRPRQHQEQHQQYAMGGQTAATLVQKEITREDFQSHFGERSGSPVSWDSPARGTLFIVNHRNSEDL